MKSADPTHRGEKASTTLGGRLVRPVRKTASNVLVGQQAMPASPRQEHPTPPLPVACVTRARDCAIGHKQIYTRDRGSLSGQISKEQGMTDPLSSCARPPTVGPILSPEQAAAGDDGSAPPQEVPRMIARVGKPAPDFETTAYH